MRWQRLFDDLEAQSRDLESEERDALAADLHDETWYQTSWRALLGGRVRLDVEAVGPVEGDVARVGRDFVVVERAGGADVLVALDAVVAVLAWERRSDATPGHPLIGWGPALRALRDEGEVVSIVRRDARMHAGPITVVGKDFLTVAEPAGDVSVLWTALATVSVRY
jgi:hypothetical protein